MKKRVFVTKSAHFRADNTFILKVCEGNYITKLECIGQRNLDHDLAHFRAMGYKIEGEK